MASTRLGDFSDSAWLPSVCGTPLFANVTASTTAEDGLTPCLVFVALPLALLLTSLGCSVFLALYGVMVSAPRLAWHRTSRTKMFLSVTLVITSFTQLGLALATESLQVHELPIGRVAIAFVYLLNLLSYGICFRRGIVSSIWLHLVWFLRALTLAPESVLLFSYSSINVASRVAFVFDVIYVLALNLVFCFADSFYRDYEVCHTHGAKTSLVVPDFSVQKVCPERYSSSISRILFSCGGDLISKGYKSKLSPSSFWALDVCHQPEHLLSRYERHCPLEPTCRNSGWQLIPWIFPLLVKASRLTFLASMFCNFLFAAIPLIDPLIVKVILDGIEHGSPMWYLSIFIVIGVLGSVSRFVLMSRGDFYGLMGNLDVSSILMNLVYQKLLKLSPTSRVKYSAGEVVNLQSTDVDRIGKFWLKITDVVYVPTTIIFSLVALFWTIGHNVWYGIAVMVAFVPFNSIVYYLANVFERRQMQLKDDRLKLMTDILSGMKIVKLYAWEESMRKQTAFVRAKEVSQFKYAGFCYAGMEITFAMCPILATVLSLLGYIIIDERPLTPQIAFVSLLLFNIMRFSVYRIPGLIREVLNARISMLRIQAFLEEEELRPICNSIEPSSPDNVVELRDASFAWDLASPFPSLKNITACVRKGELVGIVGRVGAGKSSLLSAICGELQLTSGDVYRRPSISVATVSQEAWIQNLTVRDNILFGKPFNPAYYRQILAACALQRDLKAFSAGDFTEIGERGTNLSGGQKARVSLARAVYQKADLYILDDTLSAVDSHVGTHIFEEVIGPNGLLADKTRIFALNSVAYLAKCDRVLVLKDGAIVDSGTYEELLARQNSTFYELVHQLEVQAEKEKVEDKNLGTPDSFFPAASSECSDETEMAPADAERGRLIKEEFLETHRVSARRYLEYGKAFGCFFAAIYFVNLFVVRTSLESTSQVWLSKWSNGFLNVSGTTLDNVSSLKVYSVFALSASVAVGLAAIILSFGAFRASKMLHDNFLFALLRSPMSFFDTTPAGRILNRLSGDMAKIDEAVPQVMHFSFVLLADAVFLIASAVIVLPLLGIFILPLAVSFIALTRYFTFTSVQIRRCVTMAWSAVNCHLQDSYIGMQNIRTFAVQERFARKMMDLGRGAIEARVIEVITNRWITVRMDLLTTLMATFFTVIAVLLGHTGTIPTGAVALVMSTGSMLRRVLSDVARGLKNVEMAVVAVERVQEYIANEPEASWESGVRPPAGWPRTGAIEFKEFSLRYRPETPLVLKKVTFAISSGQKVGIVGRTGAGKTSLTMALFRIVEPAGGTIVIDGVDFQSVGLHDVRRALTIIPQDPVLFCGDLRANLDPFEEFSDNALWQAVEKAHLRPFVEQFPLKLQHEIGEGGSNLSVGQRQLVCLARAILRRQTRILILDEATAAVDLETDNLIQKSIRTDFAACTVLTIAHRLNTIMDYDKVLVMQDGCVHEFDSPGTLLTNRDSLFFALASQAGLT